MPDRTSFREDLRIGVRIAAADVRDLIRRNSSRREQALLALLALFVIPGVILFLNQSYQLGVYARGGIDAPVVAVARNLLVPTVLVMVLLGGLGAAQSLARDSVQPLLLTSASTRAIVIGKLLYLFVTWSALLAFALLFVVAFAIGARAPLFLAAIVLAGTPLVFLMLVLGLLVAYLMWTGIEYLGLPERFRRLLTASLSVIGFIAAFVVGMLSGQVTGDQASAEALPTGDPIVPLGWYADLLFLGSPVAESLGLASIGAAVAVFAVLPASFLLLVRVAPAYWYATPTRADDDPAPTEGVTTFDRTPSETIGRRQTTNGESADRSGLAALVAGVFDRSRLGRLTGGYIRAARRRPDQYVYLFYYLFPVLAVLVPFAVNDPSSLPPILGLALLVLGVWCAGGVFCLNPLGSEGSMLSQLILATESAATFVHARLLAGVAVGLPLAIAGGVLVIFTSPVATPVIALVAFPLIVFVVLGSACFALGIGAVLPKFETIEVFDSVETLAPSLIATVIHGAFMLLFLLGALGSALLLAEPQDLVPGSWVAVLVGCYLVALGMLADGSRRYAIARFRDYGKPTVRPDRPFALYASVGVTVLAFTIGQVLAVFAVLLFGFDLPQRVLLPLLFVIEYLGYLLVAGGFLWVTHRGIAYLDLEVPDRRDLLFIGSGVLASLAIWLLGMATITGLGLPAADHALFSAEEADPTLLLLLIPLLLLVNGPVEELFFRNLVQKYLAEQFSPAVAIAVGSLIFALVHVPAYLTAGLGALLVTLGLLLVLSLLWGWIYHRTGSLLVVAVIHGVYNAALVGMLYVSTVWG